MKITEYPSVETLDFDNVLLIDGPNGTKTIGMEHFPFSTMALTSERIHRTIFRGKNLGSTVTTAQKLAISNGTFEDLWLGDYWVIGGRNWRIWDFDYWLNCGDDNFTQHHLVIMPDTSLYNATMNATNVTTGGYVGSAMYTSGLGGAKSTINSAFPGLVLSHKEYLVNAVTDGKPSGGAWFDSTIELPNECMIYGHLHFSPTSDGSKVPSIYTPSKTQLALGMIAPNFINIRVNYWLRDVVSATYFAYVDGSGLAGYYAASSSLGVRPVFAIGG